MLALNGVVNCYDTEEWGDRGIIRPDLSDSGHETVSIYGGILSTTLIMALALALLLAFVLYSCDDLACRTY